MNLEVIKVIFMSKVKLVVIKEKNNIIKLVVIKILKMMLVTVLKIMLVKS